MSRSTIIAAVIEISAMMVVFFVFLPVSFLAFWFIWGLIEFILPDAFDDLGY